MSKTYETSLEERCVNALAAFLADLARDNWREGWKDCLETQKAKVKAKKRKRARKL